jgi:hypothetical protein
MGFHHLSALPNYSGREPGPPHAWGLPDANKHCPLHVYGSIGPKHWPGWDVLVGTHVPLALDTHVGNPSDRCPTLLCLGNTPK